MARSTSVGPWGKSGVTVRIGESELERLQELLFRRYPAYEWATFARVGWVAAQDDLVITIAALDPAEPGELDATQPHVVIVEQFTLRIALQAEKHRFGVCVIHSHPEEYLPIPSPIDDDMDTYYADYFSGFAPDRPYLSLIASKIEGALKISGRVFWRGQWLKVTSVHAERIHGLTWEAPTATVGREKNLDRLARLRSAFGDEAAALLRKATVAVIGAGGTGSAAIGVLARAGVGHLIIVDPDHVEPSNLERLHGGVFADALNKVPKVAVALRHVRSIDDTIRVTAYKGRLPQRRILQALVQADVILGCTDQQHSRLALSDIALRYLIPAIDCGVAMEGREGKVSAQVAQLVRFLSTDPCALCRDMIAPQTIAQELMSPEEKARRRAAAAVAEPGDANAYWREMPQLNTVGYLTTVAGSLAAGYAMGWVTGRFDMPFARLQMDMMASHMGTVEIDDQRREDCACQGLRGTADQSAADSLVSAPSHWPDPELVE